MYWKLEEGFGLRSWLDKPRALLRASDGEVLEVSEADFGLLKCCDGVTPVPDGERLRAFEARGWIARRDEPDPIDDDQRLSIHGAMHFRSANIAVTGRCNYNCRHCFMAKDSGASRSEFSFEQLERMLDECVRCGIAFVSLTGGEPLLRGDFARLLRAISARGLKLENITTNGSLLTDDLTALMRELGQRPLMRVSFDGVGWHDWMRGVPGSEQVALEAIRRLREADFPVLAQMCVHTDNIASMRETAELMAGLGVNELRIIRTGESPRWVERSGGRALSFEAYYDAALEFLNWYLDSGLKMDIAIWAFVRYFPATGHFHCLPVRCPSGECGPETPVCADAQREVFIGFDGEMSPCSQISGKFGAMGISLGNVLNAGLEPLLKDSRFLQCVRLQVKALADECEECRSCEYMRYCLGGCRAMACAMTDDYFAPDRMSCVFFKKGYWKRVYDAIKGKRSGGGVR